MEETREKRGEMQQTCDRKAPGEREVELILIRWLKVCFSFFYLCQICPGLSYEKRSEINSCLYLLS